MPKPDTMFTLLAPRSRHRNALLTEFMAGEGSFGFYALTPQDATLRNFLGSFQERVQDTYSGFGHQTAKTLADSHSRPEDLARAFHTNLAQAKPPLAHLFLDQFDYLTLDEDVHHFFLELLKHSSVRIVINSRQLPMTFWAPFINSGQAQIVGDESAPEQQPDIDIGGFSHGHVLTDGLPVTEWTGPLVRNLFYYLADHPMVTRAEIFEAFWPDLPTKEATNVFHVTKRKITECLGRELTTYSSGFYRHTTGFSLYYDVAAFEILVNEAADLPPGDALPLWEQAVQLYRLPFLYGLDMPWIVRRREQLKAAYVGVLVGIARFHRASGNIQRAIPFYRRAAREFPTREDVCRDLMELFREQGQPQQARDQYLRLQSQLQQSLGIEPSAVTQRLYQSVIEKRTSPRSRT